MTPEHAEVRYFTTRGPLIDSRGRKIEHKRHFVVSESWVGSRKSDLRIVAACNDTKAANAARRLLSGKCEAAP